MLSSIIRTMRLRQWTKNAAVLLPLFFDRQFFILDSFIHSAAAFILFCLLSSAIYFINDISDIEEDRQHPKKRFRPIASGELSVRNAVIITIILLLIVFPLSFWLSILFGVIVLMYFFLQLAYSKWLKHIPLVDVLVLAGGFVLRVGAGVSVIEVERFSPWLYVVATLLALYLGFGKRRSELASIKVNGNSQRKVLEGYSVQLLDQLITIVSGTTIIAYSLYTFSAPNLPDNHTMMLTIPFVLYGIFRYLYLINVQNSAETPEEILLHDRPLQLAILLYGLTVMIIFYIY